MASYGHKNDKKRLDRHRGRVKNCTCIYCGYRIQIPISERRLLSKSKDEIQNN